MMSRAEKLAMERKNALLIQAANALDVLRPGFTPPYGELVIKLREEAGIIIPRGKTLIEVLAGLPR